MGKTLRLFYAVPVPDDVRHELRKVADSLGHDWRPSPESQLHITLAFMGEVPEEDLPRIIAAGEAAAQALEPFSLKLGSAGGFPNDHAPRVWFVHAESPGLLKLYDALKPGVVRWADAKPFKGHLTIARPRSPGAAGRPMEINREWQVERFELIRSNLGSSGAEHTLIRAFHLSGY
ncbi:MAG TPA: RNA 2',3'-cyclic phosphodiesterase [Candidatus Ozemobacteraceae bacterium]|nr:RNA 2',3'-cyclic phosphodiesterase [Candidatus Ozemobacteraceae bacterium]